ncbi:MAG: tetratricopeptide repeat protein [Planctomycetales bacterium]|nr:tetratricopeptide repeat protein [Planctomycetales bacterium]
MSRSLRTRRQQLLREAEGYLDLATVFGDRWGLKTELRDLLAQRALDQLRAARALGGATFESLYLQGEALRTMERWDEAIEPLEAALAADHLAMHVRLALAWCYKRLGKLTKAIEALEEAVAADPSEAILHYNLACYWSLAGNVRMAVRSLTEAFDIDPEYRDRVADETDFDPIRQHPAFLALTSVIV